MREEARLVQASCDFWPVYTTFVIVTDRHRRATSKGCSGVILALRSNDNNAYNVAEEVLVRLLIHDERE